MNIKEAKEQIKNAMKAYFTKDEFGRYVIPVEKQRPVFLMGPPGIGKTAVMEQIAQELSVGLVSYSMTHHTRQSALGLPFIEKKTYGGKEYSISQYTMSEIIASVYDVIEETGHDEGILFLDEINCVSETLAPSMLLFLQYKMFGQHKVPDGWIVVTAGNPPEYNKSVREFDIVTWDRLKRIDVEPDYEAWKEYAYKSGVHASIMTYLDIKKSNFYKIETTVDGKNFVTARGWSDLSDMIKLYEQTGIEVNEKLVSQYLQNKKIAKDFSIYYDLYNKYKTDYQIDRILEGRADDEINTRAGEAKFDERLSLLGLLTDGLQEEFKNVSNMENTLKEVLSALKNVRDRSAKPESGLQELLEEEIENKRNNIRTREAASALSEDDYYALNKAALILSEQKTILSREHYDGVIEGFNILKNDYDLRVDDLKKLSAAIGMKLKNAFLFCENVFGEGQEMLIFVTELTTNYYSAHFISRYGSDEYFKHNRELLFYERQKNIMTEIENLGLEQI